jgi:polar amino acid transport system substrate-binding protein
MGRRWGAYPPAMVPPAARLWLAVAAVALVLGGCEFPADVDGTLDRVRGGTLRVGVTPADPFVILSDGEEPQGVEPELVRRFARRIGATVDWVPGSESELMAALHGRQLDIVVAGLTRRSAWQQEVTLTRPYLNTQWLVAAPDEETARELSEDLEGHEVAVEANSGIAAKLAEDTDATVVPVDDLTQVDGPAAVEDYLLDDLGLIRTDAELDEHEHAMAVSMGENAFLVELERFLLDSEGDAERILAREGKP